MKLIRSTRRELALLSRSIYFYVEIAVALLFLSVLLLVIPEKFDKRTTEYACFDMSADQAEAAEEMLVRQIGKYRLENVEIKNRGRKIPVRLYTTDMITLYVVDNTDDLKKLAEDTGRVGYAVRFENGVFTYEYYLQGSETERFKNYAALIASGDFTALIPMAEEQNVQVLEKNAENLNDRQSVLPPMLTVNCVLMGIFITAAYIIEDKSSGVIDALRVLPAGIGLYLSAKAAAVILTSLITCLVIAVPVIGRQANYLMLILIIICGGFLTVSAGALLAGFFSDMGKAFTSVYIILMLLLVPIILSLIPSYDALWQRFIPSYYVLICIKAALTGRDSVYVLICCGAFCLGGAVLLLFSSRLYKSGGR